MIKFFRKIRQNMLDEGKTGKYLKYAIGEIVLVVIGIVIALQIGDWNEKQQALNEIESNFQNLIEDLESNKAQLLNLIKEREYVSKGGGFLLDKYENKVQVSENEFVEKLKPVLSERYFEINRNGIDKVLTSSAIELKEMEIIRELIKSYIRDTGILKTFETKENAAIENMEMITAGNGYFRTVWKTFRKNRYKTTTEYNNPDFDFLAIMDNDELLYMVFRYEFVTQFSIKHYNILIEKGDKIIKTIENYKNSK